MNNQSVLCIFKLKFISIVSQFNLLAQSMRMIMDLVVWVVVVESPPIIFPLAEIVGPVEVVVVVMELPDVLACMLL